MNDWHSQTRAFIYPNFLLKYKALQYEAGDENNAE